MMAIVAGTAPCFSITASTFRAISRFCGYGMPCVMMVDSSATTGCPASSAFFTAGEMDRCFLRLTGAPFGTMFALT